jgi:hypothetical protein
MATLSVVAEYETSSSDTTLRMVQFLSLNCSGYLVDASFCSVFLAAAFQEISPQRFCIHFLFIPSQRVKTALTKSGKPR